MKKIQKALLATSMAGAVLVSAGYGTYSWFTSNTKADGAIQNGTVSVNNGEVITTKLFSASKFAPSQVVKGNMITIDNTGDMAQILKANYTATVDKASADPYKIFYMALKYKVQPDKDQIEDWRTEWEKGFLNGNHNEHLPQALAKSKALPKGVEVVTGEVSVEEAQAMSAQARTAAADNTKTYKLGNDEFFTLNEDEYISIVFDVKLDQKAGNEYQGARYDASLSIQAKQTDDGAKFAK
jgi:spore coat-associated protein N